MNGGEGKCFKPHMERKSFSTSKSPLRYLLVGKATFWYVIASEASLYHSRTLQARQKERNETPLEQRIQQHIRKFSLYAEMYAERVKQIRRTLATAVPPNPNLTIFDRNRMAQVDEFYLRCQQQRDYYRDRTDLLQQLPEFRRPLKRSFMRLMNPTEHYLRLHRCSTGYSSERRF